ncbi:MAG: FHA domain-containing protein [Anaerolineales bacterium]|nr:FHA domain-containing protein [Anaerolineales bacterium]
MTDSPRLVLPLPDGEEQEFELSTGSFTIGRGAANDIVLVDDRISRIHARLDHDGSGWFLHDLGSANGSYVNGVKVEKARLSPGDTIRLGTLDLAFAAEAQPDEPALTVIDTPDELNATIANATIAMTLAETRIPRLVINTRDKTWEIPLTEDSMTIGRMAAAEIHLPFPNVSRRHAEIVRYGDRFRVRDLGSGNGTWVRGQAIDEYLLDEGDTVRIGSTRLIFKSGFEQQELTMVDLPSDQRKRKRMPVVVVPGMMGSQLWRGGEKVWPNVKNFFSDPSFIEWPEVEHLEPRGIVKEVVIIPNLIKSEQYNRLGDYLEEGLGYERGADLIEFAYDWRQDVRDAARQLAQTIQVWEPGPQIILIAHSLGCLVSRYYIERLGGKNKVARLILLGGPHLGVPKTISTLLEGPDILPFGFLGEKLRKVVATFPSVYQILPTRPCVFDQNGGAVDVLRDETWIPDDKIPLLRAAREFRRELGVSSSVPSISIFGYGLKTINTVGVERDLDGRFRKIKYNTEQKGDATIPEWSTVLKGSEIHPVQQYHGSLYVDNDVKMRLKLELTRLSDPEAL